MERLPTLISAAIGMFAGTNLDDLVVLTVLFLAARAKGRPRVWEIWLGQYLGIAALVAASGVAALGMTVVPDRWAGWLGLVPLALGICGLAKAVSWRQTREHGNERPTVATGVLPVVWLTIANGADNVAVYTPLFRTTGLVGSLVVSAVFALMTAIWCVAGSWLGSHKHVVALMERHGHWIVPVVFIVIGALILLESGVLKGGAWPAVPSRL